MGWSSGYTIYEKTIISTYDSGALTPDLCRKLIEPYQETDIDHGGCCDLKSKDGLTADQIVVMLLAPEFWKSYKDKETTIVQKYGNWDSVRDGDYNSPGFKEFDSLYETLSDEWDKIMKL